MKATLFIIAAVIYPSMCFAQKTAPVPQKEKEEATKIGVFSSKKGELIIKEFIDAGKCDCQNYDIVKTDAATLYNPGKESGKLQGLRITIKKNSGDENVSFLDLEEVESLLKATDYILDVSAIWRKQVKPYTECNFTTKDNFLLGMYQDGTNQVAYLKSGNLYPVYCFFESVSDIKTFQTTLQKGLSTLKASH